MFYFVLSIILSLFLTLLAGKFARHFNIVDNPDGGRHSHKTPVPLLGGMAIFLCFWVITIWLYFSTSFLKEDLSGRQLLFLFLGSLIIMILGFFDDWKKISAFKRLLISAIAVIVVLIGGMNFDGITNPLGGTIGLDFWKIFTPWGTILVVANLVVFFWILGMMYSTKVLDGLDGLSVGIVIIGALTISALAGTAKFFQPDIKLLSLVFAGSCLGFLILNFYPAKIFLGEGGSMLIGLILGFLAVASGGKIATALLVMAIPILDLGRVIYRRKKLGRNIFEGDREHLHFKLLDLGLTHRQTVLLLYALAFLFGISTLVLSSMYKLVVLGLLCLVMIFFEFWISKIKQSNL